MPSQHPLAARRPRGIRFSDVARKRLVSLPVDSFTRRLIDGAAAAAGLHIRHALVVTRFESVVRYVAAGAGVGIVPAGALPVPRAPDFHAATLIEPSLFVTLGLITLTGRYLTPAAESLMAMIRNNVNASDARRRVPDQSRPSKRRTSSRCAGMLFAGWMVALPYPRAKTATPCPGDYRGRN